MRFGEIVWIALIPLLVWGCAGRDFARATPDSLQLGKTTYAEIIARFGSPRREGTLLKNERTVKAITYAYAGGGSALVRGVTPARAQTFYFMDLVLVGHEFVSSFREDHTDFPEAKIGEIKKGETTEAQVVQLMGPPAGMFIFPLVRGANEKGLIYTYSQTRVEHIPFAPKIRSYHKALVVSVTGNGLVRDVQFSASGEK